MCILSKMHFLHLQPSKPPQKTVEVWNMLEIKLYFQRSKLWDCDEHPVKNAMYSSRVSRKPANWDTVMSPASNRRNHGIERLFQPGTPPQNTVEVWNMLEIMLYFRRPKLRGHLSKVPCTWLKSRKPTSWDALMSLEGTGLINGNASQNTCLYLNTFDYCRISWVEYLVYDCSIVVTVCACLVLTFYPGTSHWNESLIFLSLKVIVEKHPQLATVADRLIDVYLLLSAGKHELSHVSDAEHSDPTDVAKYLPRDGRLISTR